MALSDRERKLLEQLEASLRGDSQPATKPTEQGSRRILSGLLIAVLGLATLLTAAVAHQPIFGLVGFLTMGFGFVVASSRRKN